jgi:GNAT superfamily N-acetyltransferase
MNLEFTNTPSEADISTLSKGLEAHSAAFAPARIKQDLGIFYRENGRLLGGLYANIYWGWLHIHLLWVDETMRGTGLGRELMAAAEAEGSKQGCHAATVDTHSYQAPDFYQKLGYTIWGQLEEFPPGHQRIYLQKKLEPS